ncbi:alpha/beta hydrolase [Candidatus Paracaedibacter symbiosus]|uniref:alpha/beta hydrolase n=1 Tax=Candidatus Paracaedibacter symbiosus TaxID=244582 RepID=UPI00068DA05D|nr:alpha/beta fold hydrolase [Candidatus Paracaedibacter symbiosus]
MNKTKGIYLRDFCVEKGYGFLSLDYSGHGQSSGNFEEGRISEWLMECVEVIQYTGAKNIIIVGSSLGGWIMLHLALRCPDLVSGLIGIGIAPDFTKDIPNRITTAQYQELETTGRFVIPSDYTANGVTITKQLLEDGNELVLLGKGGIPCDLPVRLLHGVEDVDSPLDLSLQLMRELTSTDVEVILVKNGDHSLSAPHHLRLLGQVLQGMIEMIEGVSL